MSLETVLFADTDEFAVDATRVADSLDSLTNMVYWNESDAGLVYLYSRQLAERLRVLGTLLRTDDPHMRAVQARLCN